MEINSVLEQVIDAIEKETQSTLVLLLNGTKDQKILPLYMELSDSQSEREETFSEIGGEVSAKNNVGKLIDVIFVYKGKVGAESDIILTGRLNILENMPQVLVVPINQAKLKQKRTSALTPSIDGDLINLLSEFVKGYNQPAN